MLRTEREWQEFTRRHLRAGSIDTGAVPRIDFQRFMLAALWRPYLSGCRAFTNWVDSVIGHRDGIRVFASPPPGGPCQAIQNAFDVVCLPQDERPVRFTIATSFEARFYPTKGAEPVRQPQKYRVVYVSIKPSPSRRFYINRMRETNQRIRTEIARDSLQAYVDIFTPMLDATGQPRPELFLADSLHMTRTGYLLWRALLAPVVR